jgi:anti-sigma regulatory factor (Ser/Thr protein kinase)
MNVTLHAGRQLTEVGRARRWAGDALDHADVTTQDQTDRAVLIVSELVTNVIRHTDSDAQVRVRTIGDGGLWIEVSDRGQGTPTLPVAGPPESSATGGRGLFLVAASATEWGVDQPSALGKTVWCRIAR